jgi:hypothetical protein
MSALLDSLLDRERMQQCMAHTIEQEARQYAAQELGYEGAYLTQTAAGFAIVPGSELSQDELAEIDRAYHAKKVSGGLRVRDDAFAVQADFQWLDAMRRAGL